MYLESLRTFCYYLFFFYNLNIFDCKLNWVYLILKEAGHRRLVNNRLVTSDVEEARRSVDRAVNDTISHLFSRDRTSRLTHSELLRINRFPTPAAREIARAADIYDRALTIVRRHIENGTHFNISSN